MLERPILLVRFHRRHLPAQLRDLLLLILQIAFLPPPQRLFVLLRLRRLLQRSLFSLSL